MRIVVIGAVAAGTSAAAKARRNNENAQITVYEKDSYISYSGCGMPYYIGGEVKSASELAIRDAVFFKSRYNIDVMVKHEVKKIYPDEKILEILNLLTGEIFTDNYDKLIIATGASAVIPPIKGVDRPHVFTLRNLGDMNKIKKFVDLNNPKTAAVLGSGFIGLEVCENFKKLGIKVTLIEKMPKVSPNLDNDVSVYLKDVLIKNGISVYTNTSVNEITAGNVITSDKTSIPADIVLLAAGVKPNIQLVKNLRLEFGTSGAIIVDSKMQTSIKDIYACGDCIEQYHLVSGKRLYRPMGSTANKTGRIAGNNATGGNMEFGVFLAQVFSVFLKRQ
ncbi:MAG: FAD-dependent oxidoreductase [Eubacteriales bacterium]